MLDQPTAQLEIYGPRDIQSNWSGVGKNVLATDLCVVSSTGRFRLQVHSFAGGAMAAVHSSEKMAYTLRFRDASGQEQIQRVNGDAVVTLDGNSGADRDCSHGANSTLQIDLNETDMLARTSGRYVDQLRLSVDPL